MGFLEGESGYLMIPYLLVTLQSTQKCEVNSRFLESEIVGVLELLCFLIKVILLI
jgi:hypothetical protein